jgi:regulator of RNase E activity RraA
VNIGCVRVAPGDIVRGDADGVIVIPQEHEDQLLDAAEAIQSAEDSIRRSCRSGIRLDDARAQFNYHQLQTRQK